MKRKITTHKDEKGNPLTFSFKAPVGDIKHKFEYNSRSTANKYYDIMVLNKLPNSMRKKRR